MKQILLLMAAATDMLLEGQRSNGAERRKHGKHLRHAVAD